MKPKPKSMKIDELVQDPELQTRAAVDPDVVEEYAARMREGDVFPPVVAFAIDGKLHLVDGWQRVAARKSAGLDTIEVDVRTGTRTEALLFALRCNLEHGQRRTNQDKRRCVVLALLNPAVRELLKSDRELAKHCGVTHPFVSKVRHELEAGADPNAGPLMVAIVPKTLDLPMFTSDGSRAHTIDDGLRAQVAIGNVLMTVTIDRDADGSLVLTRSIQPTTRPASEAF